MICQFEQDGFCHASACYCNKDCGAKDTNGQPKYSTSVKKEKELATQKMYGEKYWLE